MKIFCDLDGTLLDMTTRHYKVYSEVIAKYDGKPLSQAKYWSLKRQKTPWKELLPMSGISAKRERDFLVDFRELIEDPDYLALDTISPSNREALHELSQKYSCVLVSLRRKPENLTQQVADLQLSEFFDTVLSGHSETDGYDAKIALISRELGDDQGLIVGDTEADIITGKELGLTTVAVLSGIRDRKFLAALQPDYLIESFSDIRSVL